MSIQTEINRIKANISAAYDAITYKGGNVPANKNSANLANSIRSIQGMYDYDYDYAGAQGGGGVDVVPLSVTQNGTYTAPSGQAYSPVTVNVPSSGGGGVQCSPVMGKVTNKTSYTATGSSITVKETGTYKVSWVHFAYAAGSSSTYATQLYRNGSAIGSAHSSPAYSGTTGFVAEENNVSLTAGQTIEVRARTRSGSSYYTTAGMLVIEKQ